jgi:hypothetical protein
MVEMLMENERLERLRLRQMGEDWIRAIADKAPERLGRFCQPEVVSHLLVPGQYMKFDNVTDLVEEVRGWFGDCSDFQVEHSRVERVGERLGISYRFLLQRPGGWYTIEQQSYCTMQDGRVARFHLLCSGFQPVASSEQAELSHRSEERKTSPDLAVGGYDE